MERRNRGPHQTRFWFEWDKETLACDQSHCGVGLGVAVVTGVALGAIAGVAAGLGVDCGVAVGDGVASCAGVPADAGTDGAGVATAVGVGLALGCMFIAFLSVSLPSGPNTI